MRDSYGPVRFSQIATNEPEKYSDTANLVDKIDDHTFALVATPKLPHIVVTFHLACKVINVSNISNCCLLIEFDSFVNLPF